MDALSALTTPQAGRADHRAAPAGATAEADDGAFAAEVAGKGASARGGEDVAEIPAGDPARIEPPARRLGLRERWAARDAVAGETPSHGHAVEAGAARLEDGADSIGQGAVAAARGAADPAAVAVDPFSAVADAAAPPVEATAADAAPKTDDEAAPRLAATPFDLMPTAAAAVAPAPGDRMGGDDLLGRAAPRADATPAAAGAVGASIPSDHGVRGPGAVEAPPMAGGSPPPVTDAPMPAASGRGAPAIMPAGSEAAPAVPAGTSAASAATPAASAATPAATPSLTVAAQPASASAARGSDAVDDFTVWSPTREAAPAAAPSSTGAAVAQGAQPSGPTVEARPSAPALSDGAAASPGGEVIDAGRAATERAGDRAAMNDALPAADQRVGAPSVAEGRGPGAEALTPTRMDAPAAAPASTDAPRLGAGAPQPADAPPPPAVAAVRDAAQAILVAGPSGGVELRLDLPELGAVTIDIATEDGVVRAVLSAERPETLDLMRRHAEALQRDLMAAGFGRADLSFADRRGGRSQGGPDAEVGGDEPAAPVAPRHAFAQRPTAPADRLDIRL